MFRGLRLLECNYSESVVQAAKRIIPSCRVGGNVNSKPRDNEELVAWVKAGKHSIPLPIFVQRS